MKKLLSTFCLLCTFLLMVSCARNIISPDETGTANGAIGDTMRAERMDVKVVSAKKVASFGEYTPIEGDALIDVIIYIENTSKDALTLLDTSFQIQWGEQGFAEPLPALYEPTLAPMSISLQPGETSEYHYLYSVPKAVTLFSVCFNNVDPATGNPSGENFYCVNFSL